MQIHDLRNIAAIASCDPRTVERYLDRFNNPAARRRRTLATERIEAAMHKLANPATDAEKDYLDLAHRIRTEMRRIGLLTADAAA